MSLFGNFDISASALTADRLRMDVVSSNIANANSTRAEYVNGAWQPYRRKIAVVEPKTSTSFDNYLQAAMGNTGGNVVSGVRVTSIAADPTPFKSVYDPTNPDANARGYVQMPNVDMLKEMVDLMQVSRAYESNATAANAAKAMALKALEIGK
ncbi:flagellar basal body rod protein FlgC [Aneurinibacillus sp. Ricciae_BoGa-3]|uniref:flagellar basal body rod protein FlgC n=1 Tax=Aneurinibacillus sp. Ricciae_BoGa-3 TaxID=3022697 RepID=UPI002341F8A9|nr:flagellar basal body rod protein FlgC [Aneurinibacillus sp. Ricciae_BoGa-3]WCK52903.1 flagellar basal body rod protein FlgC [Aneurinibacillus sp. Ricciae_BoGa-3]